MIGHPFTGGDRWERAVAESGRRSDRAVLELRVDTRAFDEAIARADRQVRRQRRRARWGDLLADLVAVGMAAGTVWILLALDVETPVALLFGAVALLFSTGAADASGHPASRQDTAAGQRRTPVPQDSLDVSRRLSRSRPATSSRTSGRTVPSPLRGDDGNVSRPSVDSPRRWVVEREEGRF